MSKRKIFTNTALSVSLAIVLSACGSSSNKISANDHSNDTKRILQGVTDNNQSDANNTVTPEVITPLSAIAPIDSNIELGGEANTLYYVDPRPEENGNNRALKINYETMTFEQVPVSGINPHSIDRAGETNRFYIRTQNSYSYDVLNFDTGEVQTVDLGDHKPRAIGAYNKKHNLQLLSAKDMPVVDVIDVNTDRVIATLGDRNTYSPSQITSNAGSGSATGHASWLDEDHFVLIDRVNRTTIVYKVNTDEMGNKSFQRTSSDQTGTALHTVERVTNPKTKKDLTTFYALGEGDLTKGFSPFVIEYTFDPATGILSRAKRANGEDRIAYLSAASQAVDNVKPTTHHAGITPDGKYFAVPVFDGGVHFIDRETMEVEKIVQAKLGAAHVEFSASLNLAIVTNHFSRELTIIDLATLSVKKNLTISEHGFNPDEKHLLQPHFSYLSEDGKFFYTFGTQDGDFLKIDLESLEIIDRLHTGGAPEQAHS